MIKIKVTKYNTETNDYDVVMLHNNEFIKFDPFVSCAILMSDDEYENGNGFDIVSKCFLLTKYIIYKGICIIPDENGMEEIITLA